MKNIAILGSTGSIGKKAVDIALKHNKDFKVKIISTYANTPLLLKQINKLKPDIAVVADEQKAGVFKAKANELKKTKVLFGRAALEKAAASTKVDMVLMAVAGTEALRPLVSAIKAGKDIALANKEALVMAGSIIMKLAQEKGVNIIPVDSEHSAVFQCLRGHNKSDVNRIYITGSGGSLAHTAKSRFDRIKPEAALNHPRWKMGKKITIDSATLMNKGLEVIEAMHLFGMPLDKIEVLIHPEAVIHAMVEFKDGSVLAQLGVTDMHLPIKYALSFPARFKSPAGKQLKFKDNLKLTFKKPDYKKYPALKLCLEAAKKAKTYPAALCVADEEAVHAYLAGRIKLTDIDKVIKKILRLHRPVSKPGIQDILNAAAGTREMVRDILLEIER